MADTARTARRRRAEDQNTNPAKRSEAYAPDAGCPVTRHRRTVRTNSSGVTGFLRTQDTVRLERSPSQDVTITMGVGRARLCARIS